MTKSAQKRTNVFGFLTILVLSSGLMIWMLWHFPLVTGVVTLAVWSAFAVSARLARSIEPESLSDLDTGKQRA